MTADDMKALAALLGLNADADVQAMHDAVNAMTTGQVLGALVAALEAGQTTDPADPTDNPAQQRTKTMNPMNQLERQENLHAVIGRVPFDKRRKERLLANTMSNAEIEACAKGG